MKKIKSLSKANNLQEIVDIIKRQYLTEITDLQKNNLLANIKSINKKMKMGIFLKYKEVYPGRWTLISIENFYKEIWRNKKYPKQDEVLLHPDGKIIFPGDGIQLEFQF